MGPCNSTHSSWTGRAWRRRRGGIGGVVLCPELMLLFWRWGTFTRIVKRKLTEKTSVACHTT